MILAVAYAKSVYTLQTVNEIEKWEVPANVAKVISHFRPNFYIVIQNWKHPDIFDQNFVINRALSSHRTSLKRFRKKKISAKKNGVKTLNLPSLGMMFGLAWLTLDRRWKISMLKVDLCFEDRFFSFEGFLVIRHFGKVFNTNIGLLGCDSWII